MKTSGFKQTAFEFLEQDPNPILGIRLDGTVVYCNPAGQAVLSWWQEKFRGIPEPILLMASHTRLSNEIHQQETSIHGKTWLFSMIWVDSLQQINMYGADISQKTRNPQKLVRYDALTRIATRQFFENQLKMFLRECDHEKEHMGILLIDLDDFKIINDTFGHSMGDKILQAATKRMLNCLRKGDLIARLGGDEFVIVLKDITLENASVVAQNINQAISQPFHHSGYSMEISCSIGIALTPYAGKRCSELLRHADIAMYHAKNLGKNQYVAFTNNLYQEQYQRNLAIKKDLAYACSRREFHLEYQPQFEVKTGKIFGYEALIRWDHPELGGILPHEFIPQAEQSGLMSEIGEWVIEQAIHDVTKILSPMEHLSINISLPQLTDPQFIELLCESLNEYRLKNGKIILDLSESIISQSPEYLEKIYNQGLQLSLDNFGDPNVSLLAIMRAPLNFVKFDGIFLKNIDKNPKQRVLLKSLYRLSIKLNAKVIQKGVETKKQHNLLKTLGCPYAQGHYYCKPLRVEALAEFLSRIK